MGTDQRGLLVRRPLGNGRLSACGAVCADPQEPDAALDRSGHPSVLLSLVLWVCVLAAVGVAAYSGRSAYERHVSIGGKQFFLLHDDAMISMRYAYNFAKGDGLVWYVPASAFKA
jgi:hypothetical protein